MGAHASALCKSKFYAAELRTSPPPTLRTSRRVGQPLLGFISEIKSTEQAVALSNFFTASCPGASGPDCGNGCTLVWEPPMLLNTCTHCGHYAWVHNGEGCTLAYC